MKDIADVNYASGRWKGQLFRIVNANLSNLFTLYFIVSTVHVMCPAFNAMIVFLLWKRPHIGGVPDMDS